MSKDHGLHPAIDERGVHSFCGPAAIAALTGCSIAQAEDGILAFRSLTKRRTVGKGARLSTTWSDEIMPAVRSVGRSVMPRHLGFTRVSLAAWLRQNVNAPPTIVLITGHYVTVHRGMLVDSVFRKPIAVSICTKYLRKQVKWTYTLEEKINDGN